MGVLTPVLTQDRMIENPFRTPGNIFSILVDLNNPVFGMVSFLHQKSE